MQDLHYLLPVLESEQSTTTGSSNKWSSFNEAIVGLIEDFGLVAFETLAVEDKSSMASLLGAIDRASGYVFAGARATDEQGRTLDDEASIWAQAMGEGWTGKMEVRDVQERWIERKEELDEAERRGWEEEARRAGSLPQNGAAQVVRSNGTNGGKEDGEEDDMLEEQRRWESEKVRDRAGTRVVRKVDA